MFISAQITNLDSFNRLIILVRINILGTAEIDKSIDTVTVKGYDYIDENSTLAKLYKGLKEIKDFIKIPWKLHKN